jgi:hypothetical protein
MSHQDTNVHILVFLGVLYWRALAAKGDNFENRDRCI